MSVAAGVKLARWFGDEAKRVYAGLAETDDDRDTRRLVELIQRKGGDVSARELVQSSRDFPTVADAEAAMTALEAAGKGKCSIPGQRGLGRPKARRFTLAPVYGVYVYGIPAGGTKNTNIVDVDNVDKPTATVGGSDCTDDGWGEVKG